MHKVGSNAIPEEGCLPIVLYSQDSRSVVCTAGSVQVLRTSVDRGPEQDRGAICVVNSSGLLWL